MKCSFILKTKNMKLLKGIGFAFLLFFAAGNVSAKDSTVVVINTKIYCSHCLQCGSCGPTINKALMSENGVKVVTVNQEEGTITIIFDDSLISLVAMRTIISKLGFDADDVPADPTAYENLDGCCKKK